MNSKKTVIIIVGATASGKTNLSLQLASHYKTAIISADSRQCFKELNIGVAKPSQQELNSIKHYFINSHSIHDNVNAQIFEDYALYAVEEIFKQSNIAIMVGGTGMYIKAFCEGLDEIPAIDLSVRNEIINFYNKSGLSWLQSAVEKEDIEFWNCAEQKNPQRLIRALEVKRSTGISITTFRKNKKKERPFNIIKIGIKLSKFQLHENIDRRVDAMIGEGLLDEVRALQPYQNLNALETVGYKEFFDYLNGNLTFNEAANKIKSNTKKYAKRQLTWFKKDTSVKWLDELSLINTLLPASS
jgi:tRNA dimethylallyltransferase